MNETSLPVLPQVTSCAQKKKMFRGLVRETVKDQPAGVQKAELNDADELLKSYCPSGGQKAYGARRIDEQHSNCEPANGKCRVDEQNERLLAVIKAAKATAKAKLEK